MQLARFNFSKKKASLIFEQCLDNKDFIGGESILKLESSLANFTKSKFCSTCGSGSDALYLSLLALGIKQEEEIICTAFSFIATAECISRIYAKPVFVDINENSFNLDALEVEKKITSKTRAIIAVELFGNKIDSKIFQLAKKYNLAVILDSAQSFRRDIFDKSYMLGCKSVICITSFFPTKILSCFGDGGAIFSNNLNLIKKINLLKNHYQIAKYNSSKIGLLSRLDSIWANILLYKLEFLDEEINIREEIANTYLDAFKGLEDIKMLAHSNGSVYGYISIICKNRALVIKKLESKRIPYAIYYPHILPFQKAFSNYAEKKKNIFKNAFFASRHILSLPMGLQDIKKDVGFIFEAIS